MRAITFLGLILLWSCTTRTPALQLQRINFSEVPAKLHDSIIQLASNGESQRAYAVSLLQFPVECGKIAISRNSAVAGKACDQIAKEFSGVELTSLDLAAIEGLRSRIWKLIDDEWYLLGYNNLLLRSYICSRSEESKTVVIDFQTELKFDYQDHPQCVALQAGSFAHEVRQGENDARVIMNIPADAARAVQVAVGLFKVSIQVAIKVGYRLQTYSFDLFIVG